MTKRTVICIVVSVTALVSGVASAQPRPGDVFREYLWYNEKGDAGQTLRVGGKKGEVHPDRGSAHDYINAPVTLDHAFDLEHATKAEVVIEKILCHDGTKGLAIQINEGQWIVVPESPAIPQPQSDYQHHTYPVVPAPLSDLKAGTGNQFRMRVAPEHVWDWPQNLINGVHLRIYYDASKKSHPSGEIISPKAGERIRRDKAELMAQAQSPNGPIARVEYIGLYEDVNLEGDGVYRQWHYYYTHGRLAGHIGAAEAAPFAVTWDTTWAPDQPEAIEVAARIVDSSGLIYMTQPVTGLVLHRPGVSVELCKPYDVPPRWVTRSGEKQQHFDVKGDLGDAIAMQLVWSSWSPGYMNGIGINGQNVFENEGPKYQCFTHRVAVEDLTMLKNGQNTLTTGKTPLYDGQMVHGTEVNWPGVMVLVRYAKPL